MLTLMWYPWRLRASSTISATVLKGGEVFRPGSSLFHLDTLRRLCRCGFLDVGVQLCLGCLYCQIVGGGFGIGLGAFGDFVASRSSWFSRSICWCMTLFVLQRGDD